MFLKWTDTAILKGGNQVGGIHKNKQTNKNEYVLNKIKKIHCAILKGGNQDAVAGAVICMYREEVSLQTN